MKSSLPLAQSSDPPSRYLQFIVLMASMFSLLAGGALAPALPLMKREFVDTPNVDTLIKLQLSMVGLFIALGAPLAGWLIDRFGRRPVFCLGVLMTALFGTSAYWAPSLESMLVTRALLGLGVGCSMTCATTLVGDIFDGAQRERFVAWQGAAMKLGGIFFTLIGGVLASTHWRSVFLLDLLALAILPGVLSKVPSRPARAAGAGLTLGWRRISSVLGVALLAQVFFYMLPTQLPFLLSSVAAVSPSLVSYVIAASIIASALSALCFHHARRRMSYATLVALSFGVAGVGYVAAGLAQSVPMVALGMVIAGCGFGLVVPTVTSWVLSLCQEPVRGRAVGALTTAIFLGQFISPLCLAPLLRAFGIQGLFIAAGAMLATLALALMLIRARHQAVPHLL
ncbi:MFS transporter [Achromobacter pestifer]